MKARILFAGKKVRICTIKLPADEVIEEIFAPFGTKHFLIGLSRENGYPKMSGHCLPSEHGAGVIESPP